MYDFHKLAQRAMSEYRYQSGLNGVEVEGEPASGLRYKFNDEVSAERFMFFRGLMRRSDHGSSELSVDGCDVIEIWRGHSR